MEEKRHKHNMNKVVSKNNNNLNNNNEPIKDKPIYNKPL